MRTAMTIVRGAVVLVLGALVVIAGAAMLVLPGPGWLVIFAGSGLLGTEFPWAARLLARAQLTAQSWWVRARATRRSTAHRQTGLVDEPAAASATGTVPVAVVARPTDPATHVPPL